MSALKLEVAKLVCCGPNGCMGLIKNTPDDPPRCWCEIPDCGRGGFVNDTAEAILKLFEEKNAG